MNNYLTSKLVIFVGFIIINIFFVGFQFIPYLDESSEYGDIENILEKEKIDIEHIENILEEKNASLDEYGNEISRIESDIEEIESKYQHSIPYHVYGHYQDKIDSYNLMVDQYNAELSQYNMVYDEYDKHIEKYNVLVGEANSLASKVRTIRYIVPR